MPKQSLSTPYLNESLFTVIVFFGLHLSMSLYLPLSELNNLALKTLSLCLLSVPILQFYDLLSKTNLTIYYSRTLVLLVIYHYQTVVSQTRIILRWNCNSSYRFIVSKKLRWLFWKVTTKSKILASHKVLVLLFR